MAHLVSHFVAKTQNYFVHLDDSKVSPSGLPSALTPASAAPGLRRNQHPKRCELARATNVARELTLGSA